MNDLLAAARGARGRAHAPYSGFKVGCALRLPSGRIVTGCNVENVAYPLSSCAERIAVGAMLLTGENRIEEALVIGFGATPCTPCGGCRQTLAEFAGPDLVVHCCAADGTVLSRRLDALLPYAFGPGDLA